MASETPIADGEVTSTGLQAHGLRFAAGAKVIVDGVDLDVARGETVAILGPSGCGKTTLLRLIAGLERPQTGELRFEGEEIRAVPAHRRGFGMMFQDFALFPHLDVAENVAFGLRSRGMNRRARDSRVAELLDTVGLSGFGARRIEALSGGERQRVALARAIAPEPKLLMLDEPLGSLDRGLREHLLLELKAVLDRLTIPAIYVTHDQFEAFAIADRVAIMRAGRFVRVGTPQAVYGNPESEFVARFLGFDNIVDGTSDGKMVRTAVGEWCVEAPAGAVRLLLRGEGVDVAPAATGPGTVTGRLTSVAFQGSMVRIDVDAAGVQLSFAVTAGTTLPAPGERVTLSVPLAQVVAAE